MGALTYAKAVYGYPMLQGCMQTVTDMTLASLTRLRTPGFDPLSSPDAATNIAAMLQMCGLNESDLLHVHFDAAPLRPAHAVLVDHKACAVVLAIRGTLCPEDAITDAVGYEVADDDTARDSGYVEGGFHDGILRAARWVAKQSQEALEKACEEYSAYRLVVT